jgi:hypothetical protein
MDELLLLHVVVNLIPPSSNHCYRINKWGGMSLTKKGEAFKKKFIEAVVGPNLPTISNIQQFKNDWVFTSWVVVYFHPDEVLNRTYHQKNGTDERYKRMDAENRLKLISDAWASAIGIDDKHFFRVIVDKANCMPGLPRVEVRLYKVHPANFGF